MVFDHDAGVGRWVHDRMQQAAYALIPESERTAFHLHLGRQLRCYLKDTSSSTRREEWIKSLFLVVHQMSRGVDLIQDQAEKDDLALLCLRAGEAAAASAAFSTAASHLEQGVRLLGRRHWRDQYQLSLDLYNTAAEVQYCNGNFERVDELLNEIFANARCLDDELWAHGTRIYSLGARNETDQAIDVGVGILRKLGVRLPPRHPGFVHIVWEYIKTERMLRGRLDDDVMGIPILTDKHKLAALQIMNLISIYTLFTRQDLLPIVSMRMLQIIVRDGMHGMGKYYGVEHTMLVAE